MNDLKFRFYHKSTKIMIYEIEVRENINDFFKYENLEVLLFSGKIDNQGFQIYAGDIVKNSWTHDAEDFEVLLQIRFCVAGYSNTMGFHAFKLDGEIHNFYGGMPDAQDLEVVGNIYENKELLGGTE